ncbi:hypothetical protein [Streptomyces sp. NPDC005093]
MNALTWAGSAAAALIALGTLLRWLFRRIIRAAVWTSAAVRLPAVVDGLAVSVDSLALSVDSLALSVEQLQHPATYHEQAPLLEAL